ncbi:MAG TPA: phosphotransferase family protein [Nitriliruptorales bacterium]
MGDEVPDGIDVDGVTSWLESRVDALSPPLTFEVIQGGRSNLTFTVTDADGRRWVLRRPPLHSVLQSAHDMGREHRIMAGLQDSSVPVPPLVGYEPDAAVTGAEFYVMAFVDGTVIRDAEAAEALDPALRPVIGQDLVDVLVNLHAVDPDEVGLGELARRQDYIARQLHRWHGQYEKGKIRDLPVIEDVHARLVADIPEQGRASIVHGDYRLDNVIVGEDGNVRAVLDWELCTLGDPLADVGLLGVYWGAPQDPVVPLLSTPTLVDGFPTREEATLRYAQRSGRDLSELDYYVAFGFWKLAIILEGVYARFSTGAYGDVPEEQYREFADIVVALAERASEVARQAGR